MEFVSTSSIVNQALQAGIIKQDNVFELQSYLETYDVALDGKSDGGFFNTQMCPDMYLTVNHPLSSENTLTVRISKLISTMLEIKEAAPQTTVISSQSAATTQGVPVSNPLETASMVVAAILLSPLLIFGLVSGCATVSKPNRFGQCSGPTKIVVNSSGEATCELRCGYGYRTSYDEYTNETTCEEKERPTLYER